jgi:hypothetical protein
MSSEMTEFPTLTIYDEIKAGRLAMPIGGIDHIQFIKEGDDLKMNYRNP